MIPSVLALQLLVARLFPSVFWCQISWCNAMTKKIHDLLLTISLTVFKVDYKKKPNNNCCESNFFHTSVERITINKLLTLLQKQYLRPNKWLIFLEEYTKNSHKICVTAIYCKYDDTFYNNSTHFRKKNLRL